MKIIITGATGLVGRHFVSEFVSSKFENNVEEIIAIGRNETKLNQLHEMGATIEKFDLTFDEEKFHLLDKYCSGDFTIIHCAAAITGATEETIRKVNEEGTLKLLNYIQPRNPHLFVLISSIATYQLDDNGAFTESHPQMPRSYYGKSKLIQEQLVKKSGIPWIIVRPPFIGGPGDENVFPELTKRIENKKLPTFSKTGFIGFVDARDLASITADLIFIEKACNNEFNIQQGKYSFLEVGEILSSELGLNRPYGKHYPYRIGMFIGYLSDIKAKITGKSNDRGISSYRIRTLTTDRTMNIDKIRSYNLEPKIDLQSSFHDWLVSLKEQENLLTSN